MKFVFVHIPRTAGTTLRNILKSIGFAGKPDNTELRNIRGDNPFHYDERVLDRKLLRGHFPIHKYYPMLSETHKFITIMRDPTERLISQFNWYKERGPQANCIVDINIRRMISDGRMNIVEFAGYMRGLYKDMVGDFLPLYDWIGIQENFENSLKLFTHVFNVKIHRKYESQNVVEKKQKVSEHQYEEIKEILSPDYKIYNEAFEKWS